MEQCQSWVLFNPWCCAIRAPIQISSNRSSIWLRVKPDVLLTASIITNVKYFKCNSSLHHSPIKCVVILPERTFFLIWRSYVIVVYMKLWPQHLAFYIFAICYIYIWCRASAIPTHVILSSSSIRNHIWLICNKIIILVTFVTAWLVLMGNNVGQIMFHIVWITKN